jgi:short-subunit dehydrogenase
MRTLVTGAARGIGRHLAEALAARGDEVLLLGRSEEPLAAVAAQIRSAGGRAEIVVDDVAATDAHVATLRRLDDARAIERVVSNAGVGADAAHDPSSWEAMRAALHTNFCGAAATLTALFPRMRARGHGHLVAIGSLASYGALPGSASYCAPKAGLAMLLDCLRMDALDSGVAVTHVELGFVRTDMVKASRHPMPQLLEPEDAARRIADALAQAPAVVRIPQPMAAATKAVGLAPRALREWIVRRVGRSVQW